MPINPRAAAAGLLEPALADHPLRERMHALAARALYLVGRQTDALRVLRDVREALVETGGLDVGPEIGRLEQQVLEHDPALAVPAAAKPSPPDVAESEVPRRDRSRALIGREGALEMLDAALQSGGAVTVSGEPGIGKTTLLEHFIGTTSVPHAFAGCPDGAGTPPFWPLSHISAQLERAGVVDRPLVASDFEDIHSLRRLIQLNSLVINPALFYDRPMATTTGNPTTAGRGKRPYHSPLREQRTAATRAAVLAAAHDLFTTKGWTGTGMRDVAGEAGIAVETLYTHFPSKRDLLQAAIDIAVVGDDEPRPVAQRDEFLAMGKGTRAERIAAAARINTVTQQRTSAYARVLREAAPSDAQIAEALSDTRKRQRQDYAIAYELVTGRTPSRLELDELSTLISPEIYLLLVDECGWSDDQYEEWTAATLARILTQQ